MWGRRRKLNLFVFRCIKTREGKKYGGMAYMVNITPYKTLIGRGIKSIFIIWDKAHGLNEEICGHSL